MKRHGLGRTLRLDFSCDDSRRDPDAVVGERGNQSRQLNRRNSNLLAHGNRCNRNLRPSIHRLGQAAGFAGQLDSSLLPESICANIFIKPIFPEPQRYLDRADVA